MVILLSYKEYEEIKALMRECKLLIKGNEEILICGNSTKVVRIRVRDINYISCDNRIITIHTDSFQDSFYGKMGEVYNVLKECGFEYVNESEIVNIIKIRKMHTNYIVLHEETELICSKNHKHRLRELIWN